MLAEQDKKEIEKIVRNIFSEGVEKLINPQFGEIRDDIQELKDGQERMERKLDAVIHVQDEHSLKIGKM
jgi:hypothetical protein